NRIKRATLTTHAVDDEAAIALVRDAKRVGIATNSAARCVHESLVADAAGPRQLKRAAAINGGVNQFVVEEGRNVSTKLGVPFTARGLRVGLLLRGDGVGVERAVECERGAMHH